MKALAAMEQAPGEVSPGPGPELEAGGISKLQSDAVLWALRSLNVAQRMHFGLDEPQDTKNCRFLSKIREYLKPFFGGKPPKYLTQLAAQVASIDTRLASIELPACPTDLTINALAGRMGFSPVELALLRFKAAWNLETVLEDAFDYCFAGAQLRDLLTILADILQAPVEQVRKALHPEGILYRAKLLSLNTRDNQSFHARTGDFLRVREGLLHLFEVANGDCERLLRISASPIPETGLEAKDFVHMRAEWRLATGYLNGSLAGKYRGGNILLHGMPGLGKTEFARSLVRETAARGFAIKTGNLQREQFSLKQRLDHFFLASELLARTKSSVIIFDDAEGTFGSSWSQGGTHHLYSKASSNQLLENNPVPTIWILNDIEDVDEAVLRRFDVRISFRRPPASMTFRNLKRRLLPKGLPEEWLARLSHTEGVTPAVVSQLERLSDRFDPQEDLQALLSDSLRCFGLNMAPNGNGGFRRQYCNANPGIETICSFLEHAQGSRLLLHGPTGTGKTALAKHLAESLDLTARVIRPSDLLGPYVGQTEQQIAELFSHTNPDEELIILDEFESLAEDRRGAHRGWEISKVAELLGRLDEYEGRVVACTNLLENVDPAIRRRFQLKPEVTALRPQDRIELVAEFAGELGVEIPTQGKNWAAALNLLAYGHVKNAVDVAKYMQALDWPKFVQLLEAELAATSGRRTKPIGFVA